jgi:hypothetical protein
LDYRRIGDLMAITQDDLDAQIDADLPSNILGGVQLNELRTVLHDVSEAIFQPGGVEGPPGPPGPTGPPAPPGLPDKSIQFNSGGVLTGDPSLTFDGSTVYCGTGTASTSPTTGDLVIVGGAGIGGYLNVGANIRVVGIINNLPMTFAQLPASPVFGMMASISDSNTKNQGQVITAGGGVNQVFAGYRDGIGWVVIG